MKAPLATLLRPTTLDQILGQDHLVGPGQPFRLMVEKRHHQSLILFGPPGTGKTTLIRAFAQDTGSRFRQLNATETGVKELRTLVEEAKAAAAASDIQTFVFIDECHRWSKSQQDVLLPVVEEGAIVFFGATTERPKFAVNSTLLSRCLVYETRPLAESDMFKLIIKVRDWYKGKGKKAKIAPDAAKLLVMRCSGDARKLITALETLITVLATDGEVQVEHVNVAMPEKHLVFDASGNEHFDYAHALQEAQQHSDADAAVYWLAQWLASGEDPAYICRRLLIAAFEDAGDSPMALISAVGAMLVTERAGYPECMIPMAHSVIATAQAGRSKIAYRAIKEAMRDVETKQTVYVPPDLRAGTSGYRSSITRKYVIGDLVKDGKLET